MMTRKDYTAIASIIHKYQFVGNNGEAPNGFVNALATYMANDDVCWCERPDCDHEYEKEFDRDTFIQACYGER